MALVAVATLLHALLTAVQRERRTLAVLRAIGFTRSQLVRSVTVQAWLLVIPALLVALPLGVAAGRWAWMTFAQELGVIPHATIPLPALAAIAAVSLVISGLVAIPPGWQATRVAPARVLRPVE
ncbi:MAG: FtsX-like permease family protein [Actinomycetota bacterium]|nr:FtsX-like permease family protein [Actinomycetota bacterium]